jgi:hypothetical protein
VATILRMSGSLAAVFGIMLLAWVVKTQGDQLWQAITGGALVGAAFELREWGTHVND